MELSDNDLDTGDLDGFLAEAFRSPGEESVLDAIRRLHGVGESLLLRDDGGDASPVLLRREDVAVEDDRRYQILGEIARGGIGVVYKGRDKDLNRNVALKVLRPEYAERDDVVQRFVEEAQVGGQLQHPGIVPVYGIGLQADGRPSFTMRLVKGRTLAEILGGNPRGIDRIAVFEQVTQAMAYAHSRGVIHRDLKPANVMVGAFGEVQVVDWGLAKVLGHPELAPRPGETKIATVRSGSGGSPSVVGSVMGTPAYMSPEQAMGHVEDLDERTDVFALGAILMEILTGQPPYSGEQKDQLVAATQCRLEPALERLARADAPSELKRIARDCLEPLPGDRPRDARVLAERLATHFADVEERARESELDALASDARAAREQFARRRALVLAAIALAGILAGVGGYLVWKQDCDARETRATGRIAAALREATGHEGREAWAAAMATAKTAVDIAASSGVGDGGAGEMLARLRRAQAEAEEAARRREADDALLHALEEVRAERGDEVDDRTTDAAYLEVITNRWPDLGVDTARLRDSEDALAFAAVFDSWAAMRRRSPGLAGADWGRIDAFARGIDPEHDELRDALVAEDPAELARFTETDEALAFPPALLATIGVALLDAERFEEAAAFLDRALRDHPGDFWLHVSMGRTADATRDFALSANHYLAALAVRPRSIVARHFLGQALQRLGDLEGAIAVWRDALDLKEDWGHGLMHIAGVKEVQGRYEEAEADHRRALDLAPEDPQILSNLGALLNDRLGRPEEAIELFRRAIGLDPGQWRHYHNLGIALGAADDLPGSIEALRDALQLAPDSRVAAKLHGALAASLALNGQREAALAECDRGIELDPENSIVWANRGGIQWHLLHDVDGARESLRRAIAFDEENAMAHLILGNLLASTGEFEAAARTLRRSLELDPYPPAHMNLGAILCDHLARPDEAILEFRRALALPRIPARTEDNAKFNLEFAYGKLREKLEALDERLATDPAGVAETIAGWTRDPGPDLTEEERGFWADADALRQRARELSK